MKKPGHQAGGSGAREDYDALALSVGESTICDLKWRNAIVVLEAFAFVQSGQCHVHVYVYIYIYVYIIYIYIFMFP